jgi:acid phosphatase type 7
VGLGEETGCKQRATSDLVARLHPAAVMPLGDEQYQHGTYQGYITSYAPTWGRFRSISHPVIGNHEYDDPNAAGYFSYFGRAAGDPHKAYYSFDLARWHVVVLNNSGCAYVGGCERGSPQERWLRRDLAAHRTRCTLAAWHEPRFSSGQHGPSDRSQALWEALYAGGVDVVLAGHDHDYERFAPLDANGRPDSRGMRSFVVGTGGVGLRRLPPAVVSGSIVRQDTTFGVLALRLRPADYDWDFVPVGTGFSDSGHGACH